VRHEGGRATALGGIREVQDAVDGLRGGVDTRHEQDVVGEVLVQWLVAHLPELLVAGRTRLREAAFALLRATTCA
jgi:hypothetical protein